MSSIVSPVRKAENAPTLPGVYVLLIELTGPVEVSLSGKVKTTLGAGRYLYCGSAKGPGAFERVCRGTCILANRSNGMWISLLKSEQ